jgi:BCD family chlorophyll transporter-like MFS transporter
MGGVLMLGLGSGSIAVTNLSLMMNMTNSKHAGVFLGTWGFAQAVGVGSGTFVGGVLRDLGVAIFPGELASYFLVYGVEIALLLLAIPLVLRLNLRRFRETNAKLFLTEAFASAGD